MKFSFVNPISGHIMAKSHNIFCFLKVITFYVGIALLSGVTIKDAAATPIVKSIRIGDYEKKTRFVIELNKSVNFNVYSLKNPNRVVIALPEVIWRIKEKSKRVSRRISGYRFGLFRHGQSRIVIDLRSPMKVSKSFRLSPQGGRSHRVIFDIVEISSKTFPKALKTRPVKKEKIGSRRLLLQQPPLPPIKKPKHKKFFKHVIALDPGHGGIDPGARGIRGTLEKTVVLELAQEVKRQLLLTGKYRVVMTRSRDVYVRLRERIAIAHRAGAHLFVSLHADSIGNKHLRGGSVYTLSEQASDKEAEALARRENKSDIIAGVDLNVQSQTVAKILIDLRQRLTKNNSVVFAKLLAEQLSKRTVMLRRKHRFAGFAVLKAPAIPSVLIEMGYLSNLKDEKLIRRASHRRQIAKAVVIAIGRYFSRQQSLK
ncbi:MAG: N-acetylmuramoyl-L-alanine amidase [Rhodospirillaceae bacterium]|nr:N-acetylmuramoyl-L-alanine amidase [Rhodospirillaceae bacterium]